MLDLKPISVTADTATRPLKNHGQVLAEVSDGRARLYFYAKPWSALQAVAGRPDIPHASNAT